MCHGLGKTGRPVATRDGAVLVQQQVAGSRAGSALSCPMASGRLYHSRISLLRFATTESSHASEIAGRDKTELATRARYGFGDSSFVRGFCPGAAGSTFCRQFP